MKFLFDRRIVTLLRVAVGVLFLMAALPKMADPFAFAKSVGNYEMLPEVAERAMALFLPPLEFLVGVCLIVGIWDAGAALLAFALMLVFDAAVGVALARGLDISCGCFDTEGGTRVGMFKILENLAITGVAWLVWKGDRAWLSLRALVGAAADIE